MNVFQKINIENDQTPTPSLSPFVFNSGDEDDPLFGGGGEDDPFFGGDDGPIFDDPTPTPTQTTQEVVCTEDILECWDGSFVSRDPTNNCEFYPCPQTPTPVSDTNTLDRKCTFMQ